MPNKYTVTTQKSWGSRIKESLSIAMIGIFLFFSAFPLLFWNEARSVHRAQSLEEGEEIVVPIDANYILKNNANKLVHLSGEARSQEVLTDILFDVNVEDVIKLRRIVEMYQWDESQQSETEEHLGGETTTTTTFRYSKTWSNRLIDSTQFNQSETYRNPADMPITEEVVTAQQVKLGEFTLSKNLVNNINYYQDLTINNELKEQILAKMNAQFSYSKTQFFGAFFYVSENYNNPQIGDFRIKFEVILPTMVSIIAKQVGSRLAAYITEVGEPLEMLVYDVVTAPEMFQRAKRQNTLETWLYRLAGFVMMYVGLLMIFSVLTVLASVVPMIGSFVEMATAFTSFIIATTFSTITIAIAWLFYRPLFSIVLLVVIGIIIYYLNSKRKNMQANNPPVPLDKKPPASPIQLPPAQPLPQPIMTPQQPMRIPAQQAMLAPHNMITPTTLPSQTTFQQQRPGSYYFGMMPPQQMKVPQMQPNYPQQRVLPQKDAPQYEPIPQSTIRTQAIPVATQTRAQTIPSTQPASSFSQPQPILSPTNIVPQNVKANIMPPQTVAPQTVLPTRINATNPFTGANLAQLTIPQK